MSRNSSGVMSRISPPGATGYIAGTDALASEVNNEMNDIVTELTNSIDKGGRTTITANLPMAGFKHTGAAVGAAAGQYLEYTQALKLADISNFRAHISVPQVIANNTATRVIFDFTDFDDLGEYNNVTGSFNPLAGTYMFTAQVRGTDSTTANVITITLRQGATVIANLSSKSKGVCIDQNGGSSGPIKINGAGDICVYIQQTLGASDTLIANANICFFSGYRIK